MKESNYYTEYDLENLPISKEDLERVESMPYAFDSAWVFPTHVSIQTESGYVYAVCDIDQSAWCSIDTVNRTWEYQDDDEDGESYVSGNFYIDDEDLYRVVDFDGSYELPKIVRHHLRLLGYTIDL